MLRAFNSFAMLPALMGTVVSVAIASRSTAQEPAPEKSAAVKWERVRGGVQFPPAKRHWLRVTGKVEVLGPHLVRFADGTEASLLWNMSAPGLEQEMRVGEALLPAGREATEFLRKLIGDREVSFTAHPDAREGNKVRGAGFVGETSLEIEMIRNGWGFSDHEGLDPWEMLARENKRGMWKGEFVPPRRWHQGERLPGEDPANNIAAANARRSNDPTAILGRWDSLDRHVAMGSLFQPVHGVRKREAAVFFEQTAGRLAGHAVMEDHKAIANQERWTEGRTQFQNVRFENDRLTFEFSVGEWFKTAGPIAVENRRLENKGMIRVDATLEKGRLTGRWRMFLADETEVFRGEWEAERAVPVKD